MKFNYYYQITQDEQAYRRRVTLGTIGHIMLSKDVDKFLCGEKKPDLKYHDIRRRALPGYKLCGDCTKERHRLINELPDIENFRKWWVGGRNTHKESLGRN